jgi:hypothetical protein
MLNPDDPIFCECGLHTVVKEGDLCDECFYDVRDFEAQKARIVSDIYAVNECRTCGCSVADHHAWGCKDTCGCPGFKEVC